MSGHFSENGLIINFFLLHLWLYCLCRIWDYQSEIDWQYHFRVESTDQNSKVFFLSKKYRLLRCSLLSKLDIWKRIVELVRTCSLWLLHILLLDIFHLNTRCRHTRVHLEFTFEVCMYFTCFCLKCVKEALVYMVSICIFGIKQCHRLS